MMVMIVIEEAKDQGQEGFSALMVAVKVNWFCRCG